MIFWSQNWKREIVFTEKNSTWIFCRERLSSFLFFIMHLWNETLFSRSRIFQSIIWKLNHCRYSIIKVVFIQIFVLFCHVISKEKERLAFIQIYILYYIISREEILVLFLSKHCEFFVFSITQRWSLWDSEALKQTAIFMWVFFFLESDRCSVTRVISEIIFQ